jgi:hypothetical protein
VDEGLSSLGDSSKQAIYFHLDKSFNIKKEQIPQKIEAFVAAIEKIFGIGANFVEVLIMRKLDEKIGQESSSRPSKDVTFNDYIVALKKNLVGTMESEKISVGATECDEITL